MTKTNGYYWCDNCDEGAFGRECPSCHRPARFVTARAERRVNRERLRAVAADFFALKHSLDSNSNRK